MRKYLWDDQIISVETAAEVIEAGIESFKIDKYGFWTIALKDDPSLIGFCGLRRFSAPGIVEDHPEILYGLFPEHCGLGIATEAAAAVIRFGFEEAGLTVIYAGADPPNQASFRVMERLGMKFYGKTTVNGLEAIYYSIRK